jgi:probable rRNA maturation factor
MIRQKRKIRAVMVELTTEVQNISSESGVPESRLIEKWAATAYGKVAEEQAELTVRIVDEDDGRQFNEQYRKQETATNVLSFPFEDPPNVRTNILGDIVACAPVISREAQEQGKTLHAHWAHLIVHGVLHLCGYHHEVNDDAQIMQRLETEIVEHLGFSNPHSHLNG